MRSSVEAIPILGGIFGVSRFDQGLAVVVRFVRCWFGGGIQGWTETVFIFWGEFSVRFDRDGFPILEGELVGK